VRQLILAVIEEAQTARHTSPNSWRFPGGQGFTATLIQAAQKAYPFMLGAAGLFF
jgi:hypothetical protein